MGSLMIQGTSSYVGKSVFTAGLGNLLQRYGYRVCPFKPQNISSVTCLTEEGDEIGYTQWMQAMACGTPVHPCMNPVLIKVYEEYSRFIINGKTVWQGPFEAYGRLVPVMKKAIKDAFVFLQTRYDVILIEGAGSPAEINRECVDLSNMETAISTRSPVVLIADMEKGGAFASVAGTMELLDPRYKESVKGFVFNKYSGDPRLLKKGVEILKSRYSIGFYGVLPFMEELVIPEEDTGTYVRENREKEISEEQLRRSFRRIGQSIEDHLDVPALLRLL